MDEQCRFDFGVGYKICTSVGAALGFPLEKTCQNPTKMSPIVSTRPVESHTWSENTSNYISPAVTHTCDVAVSLQPDEYSLCNLALLTPVGIIVADVTLAISAEIWKKDSELSFCLRYSSHRLWLCTFVTLDVAWSDEKQMQITYIFDRTPEWMRLRLMISRAQLVHANVPTVT